MLNIVGIGGTLRENSRSRGALEYALQAAASQGANIELLDLNKLRLPFYEPNKEFEDYGENVRYFVETTRADDGLIVSTAAYHGTMAGVTKNALDFCEFLAGGDNPYFLNKVVGAISVAGGTMAGGNVITALTHITHSLRGTAIPFGIAIPQASKVFDKNGNITDEGWQKRLTQLGELVVDTARKIRPESAFS